MTIVRKIFFTIFTISIICLSVADVNAQMMNSSFNSSSINWDEIAEHTLRGEKEGKELWNRIQSEEISCDNINDEQFMMLGEYFMGQMTGESHISMNAAMTQMHGEKWEEQVHILMGKRFSGCDSSISIPGIINNGMPMMRGGVGIMNYRYGYFGGINWVVSILWWILIVIGMIAIAKFLISQLNGRGHMDKNSYSGKKNLKKKKKT